MQYLPEPFRPLVLDPLSLPCRPGLVPWRILGQPHAGNDVVICQARVDGRECPVVVKLARHQDAALDHEADMLDRLRQTGLQVPRVLDQGRTRDRDWLVLEFLPGERLSRLQAAYARDPASWCRAFGAHLARIHALDLDAPPVRPRRVHQIRPPDGQPEPGFVQATRQWLLDHDPGPATRGFVHGDHHYANLLWVGQELSAVLDWELSGLGQQEFDLAWALCLRPDQTFFDRPEEEHWILEGYSRIRNFQAAALRWSQVLVMSHFWHWGDPGPYRQWIEARVRQLTG